ncbi:hypothetical protein CUJ84_pRLN3000208 (plasmid) [Rhizobium leguminosarum]|uniref:Uncharacterized protein n=1 Tax=Rhizobium leguminosarum TaxID=384 RepID=A0A2K9ZGE6_RHILE|nr:hypothetical protein CUJ84_pRLN3000208 [Rhizobium leguminosarum]
MRTWSISHQPVATGRTDDHTLYDGIRSPALTAFFSRLPEEPTGRHNAMSRRTRENRKS